MQRGPITEEQRARMPQLYKKGQSGNPRGATSATMLRTHENARKAVELRGRMLDTIASRIATIEVNTQREFADTPELIEEHINRRVIALLTPDVNRLITDSENRGLGAPRQILDVDLSENGDRRRPEEFSDEELAQIIEGSSVLLDAQDITQLAGRVLGPVDMDNL